MGHPGERRTFGSLVIDTQGQTVLLGERPVDVSAQEFALLLALSRRPGAIVSRTRLEEALYSWDQSIESNTIEVQIHRLRRKLGARTVETHRGLRVPAGRTGDNVMPRPWSLRRRLIFTLGLFTLVASGVASAWLYRTAVRGAERMFDDALDHTAHAVLAVVRNEASELTETSEGAAYELAVIDKSSQNDIMYQVRGPNGIMVYRSHGSPVEPLAGPHDRGFAVRRIDGQDYRVFSLATELDAATIHVAQPMTQRNAWMHASVARLLLPGVALMVALVVAVLWTVRKVTQPLVHYAADLDELVVEAVRPVDGTGLPIELQSVSRAIDRLLNRVQESLLHERTLTADAAHELRHPLTAMRMQAQIARRSQNRDETDRALSELMTPRTGPRAWSTRF